MKRAARRSSIGMGNRPFNRRQMITGVGLESRNGLQQGLRIRVLRSVKDVSFYIDEGETLGLHGDV